MGLANDCFSLPRGAQALAAALLAAAVGCGDSAKSEPQASMPIYWQPPSAGTLLPPEDVPYDVAAKGEPPAETPGSVATTAASPTDAFRVVNKPTAAPATPVAQASATLGRTPDAAPTGAVVTDRATAKIRRGYEMAERGAYFAARGAFTAALRIIAEAKDERHGAPRRTIALSDGLRALDEAADFAPFGADKSTTLKLSVIVSSHLTPAAKQLPVDQMLPQQVAEEYFHFAQVQLAAAVAGEPAGSMALHALGKLASRLGRVEAAANPQADRQALALQNAALLARNDNHQAAHELGVLLAESGHYAESEQILRQVAANAPHPVAFRNLARVERKLGRADLAAHSEQQANMLASRGASDGSNVHWVANDALARTPDPLGPPSSPAQMQAGPTGQQGAAPMTARAPGMYR
jgi:tetratricopeptide (TPR) repeat protein